MAKNQKPILTKQDEQFVRDVHTQPDPWTWERIFHVEDRDHPGRLMALKANAGQNLIERDVRRMLDLNLKFQVDAFKQKQPTYIDPAVLKHHIDTGAKVPDHLIGLRMLIGKSRRGGFSTWTLAKGFKRISFVPNYACLLMAHADDSAQEIWSIATRFFNHWPNAFVNVRPADKYNSADYFEYDEPFGSRYAISTAGKNAINEAKRGWRFDLYHFSEYAHYASYADVAQCMSASVQHAWVIKESTANGKSGPFYEEWKTALTIDEAEQAYKDKDFELLAKWGTPGQYKFFFSWLDDPGLVQPVFKQEAEILERTLDDYERGLMARDKRFTLGRVKERRARIAQSKHHPKLTPEQLFMQEFPADPDEMFQVTGMAVFNQERVDELFNKRTTPVLYAKVSSIAPPRCVLEPASNFQVFEGPKHGSAYIIGADFSKGVGNDYTVIAVFERVDPTRLREVALFRSNVVSEVEAGHILALLAEFYNNAFVVPEINAGYGACDQLVRVCGYTNVLTRSAADMVDFDPGLGNTWRFGFFTTSTTKSKIIQQLRAMVEQRLIDIRSVSVLGEMRIFQVDPETDKYGHPKGEHDDTIIASALAVHGMGYAPSFEYARERAREQPKATAEDADHYMQSCLDAVARKIDRDKRKAKRQGYPVT